MPFGWIRHKTKHYQAKRDSSTEPLALKRHVFRLSRNLSEYLKTVRVTFRSRTRLVYNNYVTILRKIKSGRNSFPIYSTKIVFCCHLYNLKRLYLLIKLERSIHTSGADISLKQKRNIWQNTLQAGKHVSCLKMTFHRLNNSTSYTGSKNWRSSSVKL